MLRFWKRRREAPGPTVRPLRDLRLEVEALPQRPVPRSHPRNWVFRMKRAADFFGHSRHDWSRFFRRLNPYPAPFEHIRFRTEDGVSIAGWLGPQHEATTDWGVVLVPGMFSTKDDTVHKRRALRMWRQWKAPVMCIDMRAFGESTGIATAGWKEAYDVHAACKELRERTGVQRVLVLAESMGGAAVLNALAHDAQQEAPVISGALCFSAFVDARDAVSYISERPPLDHPFQAGWSGFRRMLRIKSGGGYERFDVYLDDVARVNGLRGLDELLEQANPKWKIRQIHAPVLLVHAADDPVVPVRHARRVERYAREQEHIQVVVTGWGGHTGFESMDAWWFWEVCRRTVAHVLDVDVPNLAAKRTPSEEPTPDLKAEKAPPSGVA